MSTEIEYIECRCGNKHMTSDYNENTGEFNEFCDICSTFVVNQIINRPEDNKYPKDWRPKYKKITGKTGYVIKIKSKTEEGLFASCVEKQSITPMRKDLDANNDIDMYAITFKDTKGNYQTQIFKK